MRFTIVTLGSVGPNQLAQRLERLGCNSSLGDDKSSCCELDEEGSTCFMRIAIGGDGGYKCTEINYTFREFKSQPLGPSLEEALRPQEHYIVKNIFAVNAFFSD
ncbi:hypothetical protein ABVK25_006132 [Lepraria finkii]|uniref:Uncharacterized protein n=1 Tax=Lepraria finkii TaxID=1340010 RepID=A0ABR4B8U6_9LECA